MLIAEHNKNIVWLPKKKHPMSIMKQWWKKTAVQTSNLKSSSESSTEPGGTMIITNSRSTAHTIFAGEDAVLLSRWNYIMLRGKNKETTIVSIFRPQETQAASWRQLVASIKNRQTDEMVANPNDMWYRDLAHFIREKRQAGHSIIIAGDFNDDLNNRQSRINQFMEREGLREIMVERYGPGPPTYQ